MIRIADIFKTELARRLAIILDVLLPILDKNVGRDPKNRELILPAWLRMRGFIARLERLVLRWKAGEDLTPRPRKPAPGQPRPAPNKPELRLPTGRFWMLRFVQPTAQLKPHVEVLVNDPEMQALLAAAPQAGRILRPLCHAFGIDLPQTLQLPPREPGLRKPRPKPARPPQSQPQAYPFPGVPRRWQTLIPGINAPKLKKSQR